MTNAEMFAKDLDRLAELMAIGDVKDELGICDLKYDENTQEYIGCKYDGKQFMCKKCIRDWLEQEAVEEGEINE